MINFLGLISLVYLFVESDISNSVKELFQISNDSSYINKYQWFILKLVNCCMCSGFWFGLIYYHDILLAALTSISAEILYLMIEKIKYNNE